MHHRHPAFQLKDNAYSLQVVPADSSFWETLTIDQIYNLLKDALIFKDGITMMPQHDDLPSLLASVKQRLAVLNDDNMKAQCVAMALHDSDPDCQAERFLRISAMINYYLECFQEAADYAALLGDIYFYMHHENTEWLSAHFNRIAGMAYQKNGNVDKSCEYFSHYVFSAMVSGCKLDELVPVLNYMCNNDKLCMTSDTYEYLRDHLDAFRPYVRYQVVDILRKAIQEESMLTRDAFFEKEFPSAKLNLVKSPIIWGIKPTAKIQHEEVVQAPHAKLFPDAKLQDVRAFLNSDEWAEKRRHLEKQDPYNFNSYA